VGLFSQGALKGVFPAHWTWKDISRVIRRDPHLSPHFGLCLHFYMVKLDQDRGQRNASYKSMVNASSSNMLSLNSLDVFFRSKRQAMATAVAEVTARAAHPFHWRFVDWYLIATQLPLPTMQYTGLKRARFNIGPGGSAVPWAARGRT